MNQLFTLNQDTVRNSEIIEIKKGLDIEPSPVKGGRSGSNRRPPEPQSGALTN